MMRDQAEEIVLDFHGVDRTEAYPEISRQVGDLPNQRGKSFRRVQVHAISSQVDPGQGDFFIAGCNGLTHIFQNVFSRIADRAAAGMHHRAKRAGFIAPRLNFDEGLGFPLEIR